MKKIIYVAIFTSWLSSGLAVEDKFKDLKESLDHELEQLSHILSQENVEDSLPQKIEAVLGSKIDDERPFLSELFLQEATQAIIYALADNCIQPGSGHTPLVERLTALQKDLVVYSALLYDFLKKIEQLPITSEQREQLHIDYLRALAKQALLLRNTIEGQIA